MPQIFSDRIIFGAQDFLGGMSPDIPTSVTNIRHLGNGYAYARAFNPMQTVPGVAYPGKAATNLTGVSVSFPDHALTSVDTIRSSVFDTAFALGGTKLYRIASPSDLVNAGVYPHTVTATAPVHTSHTNINRDPGGNYRGNHYNSVKEARITLNNTKFQVILYSWYDTTDWDVGIHSQDSDLGFLSFTGAPGDFQVGETITGSTSGATAIIRAQADDGATGTLAISSIVNTFQSGETITGGTSAVTATTSGTVSFFHDSFMSRFPTTKLGTTVADLTNGADMGHPMFFSRQDENFYLGSGKHIHKYDPTTNTFTSQALTLPEGFIVKGLAETLFDLIIFADKVINGAVPSFKSEAYAFFWSEDRPTTYYKAVSLQDSFVGGAFSFGGLVGCFTGFRDGVGSLQMLSEGGFSKVTQFEASNPLHLPCESGADVQDNIIIWNSNGVIWGYGGYRKKLPAGLHPISQYGDESGFIKVLRNNDIFVSGGDLELGAAKLENFNTNAKVTTLSATPRFRWGFVGSITGVQIRFFNGVSGGLEIDGYLNIDGTSHKFMDIRSNSEDRVYTFTNKTDATKFPTFTELSLRLDWPSVVSAGSAAISPGIVDVQVFYEPTPITN